MTTIANALRSLRQHYYRLRYRFAMWRFRRAVRRTKGKIGKAFMPMFLRTLEALDDLMKH